MESKWKAASVALALAAILMGAPAAWAKPGDLPAEQVIECDDDPPTGKLEIELNITPRGITPMTAYFSLFSEISCPTMEGSPPKTLCQRP